MARYLSCSLVILGVVDLAISRNESNILRLGKAPKVTTDAVVEARTNDINNSSDYMEERNLTRTNEPLVGFSKNNPELDWKNHVKIAAENDEERRDLDVDFMNEKLERTANSIQWLSDLYDPLKWTRVPGELRDECRRDMDWYLKSLKDGKLWAAKSK